uniref:Uncharacterized protein n=1 Tax=Bionectria ochroleuca TaxID=29856 RepID=A0A8H7NHM2_BIOOC
MATILVTGANRGIGYAIIQAIGNGLPDSTLLLGCRTLKAGEDAIEQLKSSGVSANLHALALDIEDDSSIAAAADVVRERFGHLDVLINNAIKIELSSSANAAERRQASNKSFNNGITSNTQVTRAFLPLLDKSNWPRVIMVSSSRGSFGKTVSGELPSVAVIDYCVIKAALNMLTLHFQAQNKGVTFWVVSPGHCKTGFNGFRGTKDPLLGAEVILKLLESEKGEVEGGTFWEYEQDEFRAVPW